MLSLQQRDAKNIPLSSVTLNISKSGDRLDNESLHHHKACYSPQKPKAALSAAFVMHVQIPFQLLRVMSSLPKGLLRSEVLRSLRRTDQQKPIEYELPSIALFFVPLSIVLILLLLQKYPSIHAGFILKP